jgi:hypothetical protein
MARKKKDAIQTVIERVIDIGEKPRAITVKGVTIFAYRDTEGLLRVSASKETTEVDMLASDIDEVSVAIQKFISQPSMIVNSFTTRERTWKDRLRNIVLSVELTPFDWRLTKNYDNMKNFFYLGVQFGPVSIILMG